MIKLSVLDKISRDYPQDTCLGRLKVLLDDGYTQVKWKKSHSAEDDPCTVLNDNTWALSVFISDITHDAPIYSRSHVGCLCSVIVTGPDEKYMPVEIFAIE